MPSFARELEQTLHNALGEASRRRHEYATLEHLLLALGDRLRLGRLHADSRARPRHGRDDGDGELPVDNPGTATKEGHRYENGR